MVHSSKYLMKIMPVFADDVEVELDRVQDFNSTLTINRTKVNEVSRSGIVGWRKTAPNLTATMKQLEYGSLEAYRKMANLGPAVTQVNFSDFATPAFDIAGYTTNDNGTFLGTVWYPELRMNSFSVNLSDPQGVIERSFNFVGEDEIVLQNNNKYLIRNRAVIASSGNDQTVSIANPTPVADPDNSGKFLFRVCKTSATTGLTTELEWGTDWSYDGSSVLTINGASTAGDVITYYYSAATYKAGDVFTLNNSDVNSLTCESASIYLVNSQYVYRLQSVSLDVSLNRKDNREIGSTDIISRGVQDINTKVTLGRMLESYTIEEAMRGVTGLSFGKLDPRKYTDNFELVIKIYSDSTKKTFKMAYKCTDLAPTGRTAGTAVNSYVQAGSTLEGEGGFLTSVEAVL